MQHIRTFTRAAGPGRSPLAILLNDDAWNQSMTDKIIMTPERLVGLGFRGWIAGYAHQDIACWEGVWDTYADAIGPVGAKRTVSELAAWVRQVRRSACREIETFPPGCAGFCRDECIAISVIAACQQQDCPALRACAYALIGSSAVEPMLEEATAFADCLLDNGLRLSSGVICNVAGVTAPAASLRPN